MLPAVTQPFSLNEQIAITLPVGGIIDFTTATQVSPAVPEPSTFAIAGLGGRARPATASAVARAPEPNPSTSWLE